MDLEEGRIWGNCLLLCVGKEAGIMQVRNSNLYTITTIQYTEMLLETFNVNMSISKKPINVLELQT